MSYSKVIGEAIRQERKKQKLSMAELGSRMGISGSLVGRYERGEENPKLGTIMRFADALNMEWAELAFLLAVAEMEMRVLKQAREWISLTSKMKTCKTWNF